MQLLLCTALYTSFSHHIVIKQRLSECVNSVIRTGLLDAPSEQYIPLFCFSHVMVLALETNNITFFFFFKET